MLEGSLVALERAEPGVAWQTAAILSGLPGGADAAQTSRERLLQEAEPLALLAGINDRVARTDALEALFSAHAEAWPQVWADWLLHEENAQLLSTITRRLEDDGHRMILQFSGRAVRRLAINP